MKLDELKAKVYKLAKVSTTRQLKAKYEEIKTLDMRRTVSWEKAITIVQKHQDDFKDWLENPIEEYRELFAEIEVVSEEYDKKLAEAKQLGKGVISIASNLEALSEECQDEAARLRQEVKATRRIARQAELN